MKEAEQTDHTPFGPSVAGFAVATTLHAGDTMPARTLIDHPFPGGGNRFFTLRIKGRWGVIGRTKQRGFN